MKSTHYTTHLHWSKTNQRLFLSTSLLLVLPLMTTPLGITSDQLNLPSDKFKIGLCQLSVSSDKIQNISNARKAIVHAAQQSVKLVVLPEMWNCPCSHDYFAQYAEDFNDETAAPSFSMLAEAARCNGVTIVGGSVPESENGRLYNTCCVFGPDGRLLGKHRKLHLFDIEAVGGHDSTAFKESDSISAGASPTIVDTEVGRIGIGICHDIRFPELAMLYRAKGAHLICYPGAFNMSTGEMWWELLQRARAVDNQLFVATCSPARDSAGSYDIWGHSTLVGPFGEIISTSGHEEALVIADIDVSEIQSRRANLPLEKQTRKDIYQLVGFQETNR